MGPLSKRREVNTRWRYFTREWKKILPPLELDIPANHSESPTDENNALSKKFGFHGFNILDQVFALTGPSWIPRPRTRRERSEGNEGHSVSSQVRRPSRWLRRRYLGLLGRMPVITLVRHREGQPEYRVSLAPQAVSPSLHNSPGRLAEIDEDAGSWLESNPNAAKR